MNLNDKNYQELLDANRFYDKVMDRIGIPEDDLLFRIQVQKLFENSLSQHIAISAIEHSDKYQLKALEDYKNLAYELSPHLSDPEITMEFLEIYTQLRGKVFSTIPKFVDDFVSDFNKIFKTDGK